MVKYTKKIGDMEKLPDDILSKIFIRLLAKQLAQMRCVSKSWNALLSEPNFVKSHLHRSIHNNDEILLFFKELATYDSNRCPATIRASRSPAIELTNLMKLIKLPFDPQHKKAFGTVIGSVNGLICFCYEHLNQPDIVIRIWNPSLSALLTLPPFSLSYNEFHLGFGFDPKTDDYKVVKVADIIPKEEPNNMMVSQPQGEVYSMRKGYWEPISERIPSHIKRFISQIGVCVDGHLYWLCATDFFRKPHTERIVAFDLSAMTYSEVPLPDPELPIIGRCDVLGVLGGKLCVMTTNVGCGCECDVWVMDDRSWVKHHAFSGFKCHITPYGFTSSKEFLFQFQDGCRFAFYDPIATNTKPFKIKWTQKYERYIIVEYVDSLVWIEPDNQFKSVA